MRKVFKSLLTALITVLLLAVSVPRAEMYENDRTLIRVGLYYGDTELSSANLLNYIGSGYDFGYYDEAFEYHKVGETAEKAITMMKDHNMYLKGSTYYDNEQTGTYTTIGCYHVLLDTVFDSFEAALEEANTYTRTRAFPAYYYGEYRVSVGSYTSASEAEQARIERNIPGTVFTASSKCITVVKTGTNEIEYEFDCGDDFALTVMPKAGEDEKAVTWFKNKKYYGAFRYTRISGGNLTVVNMIDIEDYIKGVVPYEMSPSWPLEALKAQALCARTYVASHIGYHKNYGFDVCSTTCCQFYGGTERANANSDRAVTETAGEYICYDGQLCETYYFSSDGGATESSENVWSEAIPYLRGVNDPYEDQAGVSSNWSYTYTNEDITWILKAKGYKCANIVSVTPTYTEMGNIFSIKFTDSNGRNWTFSRSAAGSILYSSTLGKYTRSQRFTITDEGSQPSQSASTVYVNGNSTLSNVSGIYVIGADGISMLDNENTVSVITGSGETTIELKNSSNSAETFSSGRYTVSGSGWGHNVGMSQYGAKAMAELGFTCEDIINFYYTGVSIE